MLKNLLFFLVAIFLIPLVAFSQEPAPKTTVSLTLEESRDILPDVFNLPVSVEVIAPRESDIVNILGEIDEAIRNLNLAYKGGTYWVAKNCWWESGKQKCSGYKGTVSYNFELKEPKQQNKVLNTIAEFQEKYGNKVSFTVSSPAWSVSKNLLKKTEDELKINLIDTAFDFVKKLSGKFNRTCTVQEINYETTRPPILRPYYQREAVAAMEIKAPEPVKEEKTVTVRALVKVVCY